MSKKSPITTAAAALGRLGGSKTSERKRAACAANVRKYWDDVRAGLRPAPKHK